MTVVRRMRIHFNIFYLAGLRRYGICATILLQKDDDGSKERKRWDCLRSEIFISISKPI